MSYLHSPRLVFSGDFLSDVSTVNNDVTHYNNETFTSNFQQYGTGSTNGWWNPEGGAVFNFKNCIVQQLTMPDGTSVTDASSDIIVGQIVAGSEGRPTGKMLDLDPDAQMVSALWCVQIRICTPDNELLLKGDIDPTCFRDMQLRQLAGGNVNGQPYGACWTSVLTNLVWGENIEASPFLSQLKSTTQGNKLSINLNAFGYYYNHAPDGRFSLGKIIGTIGPWFEGEPINFAACRRLYGVLNVSAKSQSQYFAINNFLLEENNNRLSIDFGNSFPISDSLGTISATQTLIVGVANTNNAFLNNASPTPTLVDASQFTEIGIVSYISGSNQWLSQLGGIQTFNNLPDNIIEALKNNQLLLLTPSITDVGQYVLLGRETIDGVYVRADNFVQRIDCDQTVTVDFYSYQWGNILPNATINVKLERATSNIPLDPISNPICEIYGNNFPQDGITFQTTIQTNSDGFGQLEITGNEINSPRVYVDGQVYTLDYDNSVDEPLGDGSNVVIHLRDYFEVPENPTWSDISAIMIQYANLYPIMSKYLVNLANPNDLIMKKDILKFAFSRDIHDTMHMPVTRDLSDAKRTTILKWLDNPIIDVPSLKSTEKQRNQNTVSLGTPLTNNQLKYKEAVKAKNGSMPPLPSITNLFENL